MRRSNAAGAIFLELGFDPAARLTVAAISSMTMGQVSGA
jgi:hypothetical protein